MRYQEMERCLVIESMLAHRLIQAEAAAQLQLQRT